MPIVHILCGLPGSGKSTWALKQKEESKNKTVIINKDAIRTMIHGVYKYDSDYEDLVKSTVEGFFHGALFGDKMDLIVDETNISKEKRAHWIELARDMAGEEGNIVNCVYFTEKENNLQYRMNDPRGLPEQTWLNVIQGMKEDFEAPSLQEDFDQLILKDMEDV